MVMLPEALTLILPEASMVMSLPAMVIVPSFFIVIEALPVVIVISSPASIDSFLPTFIVPPLPIAWPERGRRRRRGCRCCRVGWRRCRLAPTDVQASEVADLVALDGADGDVAGGAHGLLLRRTHGALLGHRHRVGAVGAHRHGLVGADRHGLVDADLRVRLLPTVMVSSWPTVSVRSLPMPIVSSWPTCSVLSFSTTMSWFFCACSQTCSAPFLSSKRSSFEPPPPLDELLLMPGLGGVGRQAVGRHRLGVVDPAGDERPVGVALQELDDHLLADPRDRGCRRSRCRPRPG